MGLSFSKQSIRRPVWVVGMRFLGPDLLLLRGSDGSVVSESRSFSREDEAHAYAASMVGAKLPGRLCYLAVVRFGGTDAAAN